jgi:mono/diheme cytochrome c family protein
MRIGIAGVISVAFLMVSCGQMGAPPELGNMEAGGEPAEGGIAEVPNPNASMAKKSGKPLSELQRGHEVYMLQCGQCHRYKLPQDLDIDEWQTAVPKMIGHAGLESADEQAVLAYVVAVKTERGE